MVLFAVTHTPDKLTTFQWRRSLIFKMKLRAAWLRHVRARRDPGVEMRPFILTGPPRSGTSLLTALLTRKPNVLVVNEPVVVSDPLLAMGDPARLLRGYMNGVARKAVREGRLTTKVDPSSPARPTTDTANHGAERQDVTISVNSSQPLCVGVKHPMSFMEYLDELLGGWPGLRAILIVRDPGPTIRSWRQTGYGWQPALDDPKLGPQRRLYRAVPATEDPLERRAHLWRILVERAQEQRNRRPKQVEFLRYEELLDRPNVVLERLFRHIQAPAPDDPIDVSDVSPQRRDAYRGFSAEEAAMIAEVCGPVNERTAWRPEATESAVV